ncbi:MAG: protein kinase [Vulcanococcus sp.]|jgi:serine/threonine protein kinase|uniref:serine/threonine-protein kinase n=1 Tax=Vulcanococcus sp. TaxID=2856995 RepID=UPI0025D49584|nr:serine/threonine-protein kinase [Vulcanococcus sp.]MBW0174468.1 protein kinase [Vulcanococcus sp.]MBW0179710.1 protein kinase [Vulcanococcus sp.]
MSHQGPLLLPELSLEPLTIQKEFHGGFGTVYIANDNEQRQYALKTLSRNLPASKNELYSEALIATKIKPHPNVLSPSGVTAYQGSTYIIMPVMSGNLRDLLNGRSLSSDHVGRIVSQISQGLEHLHDNCGLLHLDLKPENILYDKSDQYMISDFGLSKALPSPSEFQQKQGHGSQGLAGTFAYMSPEHFTSGMLSKKSDIFSLGILVYELLTGRHPFIAKTLDDLARNIIFSTPDFTLSERIKLPKNLKSICRACLSKAPDKRPSAADLVNALGFSASKNLLMPEKIAQQELTLAQIQADKGNFNAAEESLKRILSANPYNFFALSLYAQVAFNTGNKLLATSLADEALSAAVWSDQPVGNLQQSLLSLSYYYLSINPAKSMQYAKQVLKSNPGDWQALGNYAEACRILGDAKSNNDLLRSGIDACLKAIELSPNDLKLKVTYGGLLLACGDFQKLNPLVVELANKHASDDVFVRFLLIRTLIATGQHNEAEKWLSPMRDYPELEPFIQQAEREKNEVLGKG